MLPAAAKRFVSTYPAPARWKATSTSGVPPPRGAIALWNSDDDRALTSSAFRSASSSVDLPDSLGPCSTLSPGPSVSAIGPTMPR